MVMYTLLYLKWITKNVQLSTDNSTQCYVTVRMGGRVWGRMSKSESVSHSVCLTLGREYLGRCSRVFFWSDGVVLCLDGGCDDMSVEISQNSPACIVGAFYFM